MRSKHGKTTWRTHRDEAESARVVPNHGGGARTGDHRVVRRGGTDGNSGIISGTLRRTDRSGEEGQSARASGHREVDGACTSRGGHHGERSIAKGSIERAGGSIPQSPICSHRHLHRPAPPRGMGDSAGGKRAGGRARAGGSRPQSPMCRSRRHLSRTTPRPEKNGDRSKLPMAPGTAASS